MSISSGQKIVASDVTDHINNTSNPHGVTATQINGLATVATSGSYNDLSNKPTIPTSKKIECGIMSIYNSGSPTQYYATLSSLNKNNCAIFVQKVASSSSNATIGATYATYIPYWSGTSTFYYYAPSNVTVYYLAIEI